MFWIPVCVIICLWYLIASTVSNVKTIHYQADYNRYKKAEESLKRQVVDRDLEYQINQSLEFNSEKCKQIVCEFMGDDPAWRDYTDLLSGRQKALIVSMAKEGKLPNDCVSFGVYLPLAESTRFSKDGHRISPEKGRVMNEDFMLRVEFCLQKHGINAEVYCWTNLLNENRTIHMPLKQFIHEYGDGATHYNTRFQFVERY